MQKPVGKTGAIMLVLLIAGCTSHSTRPTQAPPPDARDQRQEEQRKQDRQQHEMERGELGATKTVLTVQGPGAGHLQADSDPAKERGAWRSWTL